MISFAQTGAKLQPETGATLQPNHEKLPNLVQLYKSTSKFVYIGLMAKLILCIERPECALSKKSSKEIYDTFKKK